MFPHNYMVSQSYKQTTYFPNIPYPPIETEKEINSVESDAVEKRYALRRSSSRIVKSNTIIDKTVNTKKKEPKLMLERIKPERISIPFSVDEICKIKKSKTENLDDDVKIEKVEKSGYCRVKEECDETNTEISMKNEEIEDCEKKGISKVKIECGELDLKIETKEEEKEVSKNSIIKREKRIGEEKYKCPNCGRKYFRIDSFKRHLKSECKVDYDKARYECETCRYRTGRLDQIRAHVKIHRK